MTQLTLDNWKEVLKKRVNDNDYVFQYDFEGFIDQLLTLQKQSIKEEAIKRIEELNLEQNFLYGDGLDEAIVKLRNL